MDRGLDEEVVAAQAGVAIVALRVEDSELRPPPRRAEVIPRDDHLRSLADDVPPEAYPRSPGELESHPGRFRDRGPKPGPQAGRLEQDEEGLRPAGEGGEAMEPIPHPGRTGCQFESRRQIDDEEIDGPPGEQCRRDRQPLLEVVRGDEDEPLEAHAAADGLDRVEAPTEVDPGGDRAGGLRLRHRS